MTKKTKDAFDELTVEEQVRVVQDLWDRISTRPDALVPTDAQRRELERRLRSHEQDPQPCVSWDDLRQRLRGASQ